MPIVSLNGPEALRIRRANNLATWGVRTEENRVEPVAKPAFDVPFKLEPGESIFTIGSCFARNVETELQARGFEIPMRQLFATEAFSGVPTEIVNNFGTPSIYNELAWAFGEERFDAEAAIVRVGEDRYADLHIVNSVKPGPHKDVLARRQGLLEATRALADCRVLIMTLGLAEVWWDEEAQSYLNTSPLPSVMKAMPARFSLHVLSFEECHEYLRRSLDIAFRHGRKDLQVILTVSPVAMMATHRRQDVITANSYSKSVLRAAAEHVVAADDRTTYFPSFESVTLSDRRLAWMDDLVHVTRGIVEFNVARMVNAFTGNAIQAEMSLPEAAEFPSETAESLLLAERAKEARVVGDEDFFAQNIERASDSPALAIEYARFLVPQKRMEEALTVLQGIDQASARLLRAEALIGLGRSDDAEAVVLPLCTPVAKGHMHWRILLRLAKLRKDVKALEEVERKWLDTKPRDRHLILMYCGIALSDLGEHKAAITRLADVVKADEALSTMSAITCAKSMIALGDALGASNILDGIVGRTDWQITQINQLRREAEKG